MADNFAELCSSVLWKVEIVSTGTEYLALEISKQSFEVMTWFFLSAYSKMREKRSGLKRELLSKIKLRT